MVHCGSLSGKQLAEANGWVPSEISRLETAAASSLRWVELHDLDISDVDAAVASRMQRQQLLYDSSKRFESLLADGDAVLSAQSPFRAAVVCSARRQGVAPGGSPWS
jgi:hypothetical protein